MSIYSLPVTLNVCGKECLIRSDYRVVLDCIFAMNDPNVDKRDMGIIILSNIYQDAYEIMKTNQHMIEKTQRILELFDDVSEAINQAIWFISGGEEDKKSKIRLMDWEQDFKLLIAPINQIMGQEIRALSYLHWWTFLAAYLNIGESNFLTVIEIRRKLKKGKKLEKWEREFYHENKGMVDLKVKLSDKDEDELSQLFT